MLAFQILIDGFAISALYALGATGFTLIFGVSGVLNLSHGAIMVLAAVAAWAAAGVLHLDTYSGALIGVAVALVAAFATYFAVVQPIQKSTRIPNEEKEIFVLTGTLLWYPRRPHAAQRNLHRGGLLSCDCAALAAGESHSHRKGGAGGFNESARRDPART
jgi:Branched-chain amino acid transport system / permease component